MPTTSQASSSPISDLLQATFLSLLPRIELHATITFRYLRCPHRRADCIAETIALSWLWFVRLTHRGKEPAQFVSVLAQLAARAVRSGRRLCGQAKSQDVFTAATQQREGFTVSSLPAWSTQKGSPFDEALQDNTQTPVPEQVVFRLDFPAWLSTLSERDQRLLQDLALGERTLEVAHRYAVSSARVSQLRGRFHQDWLAFCGEQS